MIPFEDDRTSDSTSAWLMYAIPGMPFGWSSYDRPEEPRFRFAGTAAWKSRGDAQAWGFAFEPAVDVTQAVTREIDASRVFRTAFVGNSGTDAEYELTGRVRSTYYHEKVLSYLIGGLAPFLWIVGFPCATSTNEIEFDLELVRRSPRDVVWTYTIEASDSQWHWIYVREDVCRYDDLLKRKMPDLLLSLRAAMRDLE